MDEVIPWPERWIKRGELYIIAGCLSMSSMLRLHGRNFIGTGGLVVR
jgi:hypothetical protein